MVSRSSNEAEYRSLAIATSELMWLQSLLQELCVPQSTTPVLWCDNLSTIALSANPVLHSRTKHMELDLYFVREKVMSHTLLVQHVPSLDEADDVLTKPLSTVSSSFLGKICFFGPICLYIYNFDYLCCQIYVLVRYLYFFFSGKVSLNST